MPNLIETNGISLLKKSLIKKGRKVKESDNKTFDLIVDDKYAEVKTKNNPFSKLDFLSFTDKQFAKINEDCFTIFLVCNIKNSNFVEIYEFNSSELKKIQPQKYTSYEYNKGVLDKIKMKKI